MKERRWLTTVAFVCTVASSTASGNWRSTKAVSTNAINVNPAEVLSYSSDLPTDSLLEVAQDDEDLVQRRSLLAKLRAEEKAESQERQALQLQQKVLATLAQQQESLEARTAALELNEGAITPDHIIIDKGTIGDKVPKMQRPHDWHQTSRGKHTSKINVTETEEQYWDRQNKSFWEQVVGISTYMVTTLIVGFVYMQFITKSVGPKLPDSMIRTDEFQYGAFECGDVGQDWYICLCAWCCQWVRWADTASHPQVDLLAYWPALFITALLSATATITFGTTMPILLLIVVHCRQRIRVAYGLPSGTFSALAWDCCLWLCCPCCAIVQEARQVEYVESRLVPYYEDGPGGGANPYETAAPYGP